MRATLYPDLMTKEGKRVPFTLEVFYNDDTMEIIGAMIHNGINRKTFVFK
jgi:hypothetical protein